ncbi:MAG: ferredoxin, partial [Prevotellaceae bacterium]|nr:ferredoxin [Prevotellaceae bacterium]
MNTILLTVAVLTVLGAALAMALYVVAQQFRVEEDPRIDDVAALLPGANCGGC